MKNTYKTISITLLVTLLIGVFLISGCIGEDSVKISRCEQFRADSIEKAECYSNHAVEQDNPQLCEVMGKNQYKRTCYSYVGARLKDSSVCDYLEENSSRLVCYSSVAREIKDPSSCEKMIATPDTDAYYVEKLREWCIEKAS